MRIYFIGANLFILSSNCLSKLKDSILTGLFNFNLSITELNICLLISVNNLIFSTKCTFNWKRGKLFKSKYNKAINNLSEYNNVSFSLRYNIDADYYELLDLLVSSKKNNRMVNEKMKFEIVS